MRFTFTSLRYVGTFNIDGYPSRVLTANKPYLCVSRYLISGTFTEDICYSEHRTVNAAQREARRRKGIVVQWSPFMGNRWEVLA